MEATKKLTGKSVKKWLGNNAIIVLMLLVSLFVGIIHPNFFAPANLINLFKNVSIRYIIALGISGCLITTGNDLSAGRLAGFAACLACIFAQTEGAAGKFYPNMPSLGSRPSSCRIPFTIWKTSSTPPGTRASTTLTPPTPTTAVRASPL